jgi:protease-4
MSDTSGGRTATVVAALLALGGGLVAAVVGWLLFVRLPGSLAGLFGVLLTVAVALGGARLGTRVARSRYPGYDVAEVAVTGAISREGGGPLPGRGGTPVDDVVEQVERADEDPNVGALLVKLNTPGGEVVPSDDVRLAVQRFDGPTVAYATDTCASGGYWIASGCDELWAREGSVVGSIGVIGSRPNVSELADRLGVDYERFAAGRFKDAGLPIKRLDDEERAYLQGIVDDYYEQFVETVAEGRGMDPDVVRETEARVFLGREAADRGLVDHLGTREDVEARLAELAPVEPSVREFTPSRGLAGRLRGGAATVAYAFGAGVADRLGVDAEGSTVEFRVRR